MLEVQNPGCEGQNPSYEGPMSLWDLMILLLRTIFNQQPFRNISVILPVNTPHHSVISLIKFPPQNVTCMILYPSNRTGVVPPCLANPLPEASPWDRL